MALSCRMTSVTAGFQEVSVDLHDLVVHSDNSHSKSPPWMFWIHLLALHSGLPDGSVFPQRGAKPEPFAETVHRTHYQSKAQHHVVKID